MGILGSKKAEAEGAPAPAGLSIIAVGMAVHGDLDSNGTVKVEGTVDGNVATRAQILVAKGGVVQGDLEAREAIVGGTVTGSIRALERVEIQTGAAVDGDITTRRIMVAEGASLNGTYGWARPRCRSGQPPATATSRVERAPRRHRRHWCQFPSDRPFRSRGWRFRRASRSPDFVEALSPRFSTAGGDVGISSSYTTRYEVGACFHNST